MGEGGEREGVRLRVRGAQRELCRVRGGRLGVEKGRGRGES